MSLTQNLRNLRIDNDKRQSDIADALQTTQQQYSRWESGVSPLPIDKLRLLCQYYGVSADYILDLPKGLHYGSYAHSTRNR